MSDRKAITIGVVIGGLILACLCCLIVLWAGSSFFQGFLDDLSKGLDINIDQGTWNGNGEVVRQPTLTPTPFVVQPTDTSTVEIGVALRNYLAVDNTIIPINDPADLAKRFLGVEDVPLFLIDPLAPYEIGARKDFWVMNTDTNLNFQTSATLRYVTDHVYYWVGDDVSYSQKALERLADTFEASIYPTTRAFFGSEWTPGVDGDEHIYILYVRGIGWRVAGYFSSADSLHPFAHEYSNAHEMFVFNADNTPLDEQYTYGVFAHEFQHMIHWYQDRNEASWVNEGFSELSALINGYSPGGFDFYYLMDPDLQLNDWPNDDSVTYIHYGSSFLFMAYFLDRMGEEITQAVVAHPENGMKSIDLVLADAGITDPRTGKPVRADDLVLDWVLTNYLLDGRIGDGRFTYYTYEDAGTAYETETVYDCEPGKQSRDVHQYGVDYIRIACSGEVALQFQGSIHTTLLPADPFSGEYAFWSNKGDESNMTLTRAFDFTDVSGPISLSYWIWYDLEVDYDYLYLTISTDGGKSWEIIQTPSSTIEDPSGNSYGWAYNGLSGGSPSWIEESVDLSAYAGEEVLLRFEYVTDAAVHGEGFILDDLSIPEIGYFEDFEGGDGGWEAAGFVRVTNLLPQTFKLALIIFGPETTIQYLTLDPDNALDIQLDLGGDVDEVVLVVVGTTRYTRQLAAYEFSFSPLE